MRTTKEMQRGFTLIEMMTAVSIFVIIMTISMGSIVGVIDANRKSRSLKNAITNINIALESMSKEMRYGSNYHCGSEGTLEEAQNCPDPGDNFISFLNSDGLQMTYKLTGTTIDLLVDVGNYNAVTSPEVVIDELQFITVGTEKESPDPKQPKTLIKIRSHAGTGKSQTNFTLQTLVSQRSLDY